MTTTPTEFPAPAYRRAGRTAQKLTEREKQLVKAVHEAEERVKKRLHFVHLFGPLLASFGVVAVFYGFEKLLDQTLLSKQPVALIVIGVILLLVTGAYYRKLY